MTDDLRLEEIRDALQDARKRDFLQRIAERKPGPLFYGSGETLDSLAYLLERLERAYATIRNYGRRFNVDPSEVDHLMAAEMRAQKAERVLSATQARLEGLEEYLGNLILVLEREHELNTGVLVAEIRERLRGEPVVGGEKAVTDDAAS